MFLILILGFGPYVLISNNSGNLEIRQRHQVLKQQGFPTINQPQTYGIIPRIMGSLIVNQQEKKEAPIFAGVDNFADDNGMIELQRQKKKPKGIIPRGRYYTNNQNSSG